MKKILVLCPTRSRPIACQMFVESVYDTSTEADVCLYIDEDQKDEYAGYTGQAIVQYGPLIGPAAAMNKMIEDHPGYEVYGAATDDCSFITQQWDKWVLDTARKFPFGIGMIAPYTLNKDSGHRMDFPWATAMWIKALGWFTYPQCFHYYWDVIVEELAKCTNIVYATEDEFAINHFADHGHLVDNMVYEDARHAICWLAFHKDEHLEKLRRALTDGLEHREVGAGASQADG